LLTFNDINQHPTFNRLLYVSLLATVGHPRIYTAPGMSKRKLTVQQNRHIHRIQQARLDRAKKPIAVDTNPSQLGPEQPGQVVANFGATLLVENEARHVFRCAARSNLGQIVCGDEVVWQSSGAEEGVISAIMPRRSLLARPTRHADSKPVAANTDLILIVVAPQPAIQTALIDRYFAAAELAGIEAQLVINKVDTLNAQGRTDLDRMLGCYAPIGYTTHFVSAHLGLGLAELRVALEGRTCVFAGQSGVGKSSLISYILPDLEIQVGRLTQASQLGRHTTTVSRLYHLPGTGAVIDSPGVRDFGLWHWEKNQILSGFKEFRPFVGGCKFSDCAHLHEPDCALRAAVRDGHISPQRLSNYHEIVHSL